VHIPVWFSFPQLAFGISGAIGQFASVETRCPSNVQSALPSRPSKYQELGMEGTMSRAFANGSGIVMPVSHLQHT
jgi:hypothetical protein